MEYFRKQMVAELILSPLNERDDVKQAIQHNAYDGERQIYNEV